MKKLIAVGAASAVLFGSMVLPVFAGNGNNGKGGPNGIHVIFSGLDSYWMTTGSGLIHEWRTTDSRHLVFKPASKFDSADCDEGYLSSFLWNAHYGYTQDLANTNDEANLQDFYSDAEHYWVCIYPWGE